MTHLEFRTEDQKRLDNMLEVFSGRADQSVTVEYLLARWEAFVGELERGFCFTASDYDKDLSIRGMLEELAEGLTEDGRQTLLQALIEPDRRFVAVTCRGNGTLARTWWKRYPQNLTSHPHGGKHQAPRVNASLLGSPARAVAGLVT